jgi:hypothetical protein
MKAPRIREAAARLADQARETGWTHEECLAAVLSREVAAREASGAKMRARAAGFPARKSLGDFSFDHQPALRRNTIAHLATGAFLTEASNIVLLGPPEPGKPTSRPAGATSLATGPPGPLRDRHRLGRPAPGRTPGRTVAAGTGPAAPLRADHRR